MEKLSIIAAIFALPAIAFMLVANITGSKKWLAWIFIKLPSLISLIALIVMAMSHFGILKLA